MYLLAFLLNITPIPSVYIVLGIVTLAIVIGAVYFYVKLWQNRKKPENNEAPSSDALS